MFELPIENNWGGHGPKEMSLFPGSLNTAGGNVREGGPGNSGEEEGHISQLLGQQKLVWSCCLTFVSFSLAFGGNGSRTPTEPLKLCSACWAEWGRGASLL